MIDRHNSMTENYITMINDIKMDVELTQPIPSYADIS